MHSKSYLATARKWRPHKFEDLVGQGHVVQTLKNAISFNRVSHAYLFSGARGIGKTTVARIFAKALRCPNAVDAIPCNVCEDCIGINEGRSVDVVEIDGASNNGVEAVRGIRDNVAYGASTGKYKIYIIDEVHMLSASAFNALLKTLEEPPAYVVFLFATTEVQKIPVTILSRCQRFELRRFSQTQVIDRLKFILTNEKISVDDDGLRLIASYSDGSMRDALSLLDQVLSFYSAELQKNAALELKQVVEALGVTDTQAPYQLIWGVVEGNVKSLLTIIGEAYRSGTDLKSFSERTLEELRLVYLLAASRETRSEITPEDLDISLSHFEALGKIAEKASLVQLERMAQILSKALQQFSWSSLPRFVLEMAVVRMCRLDTLQKIEEGLLHGEVATQETASPVAPAAPSSAPREVKVAPKVTVPIATSGTPEEPPPIGEISGEPVRTSAAPSGTFESNWKGFVDFVMKRRPLLGALLTHANFSMKNEGTAKVVTLAFPEGSFYEKQAVDPKNFQDTNEALRVFFGKETRLELSNAIHQTQKSLERQRADEVAQLKKEGLEHPSVVQMKQVLGAEVVDIQVEMTS